MGAVAFCDNSPQVHYRKHTVPFLCSSPFPFPHFSPKMRTVNGAIYLTQSTVDTHIHAHAACDRVFSNGAVGMRGMGRWRRLGAAGPISRVI